MPKYSKRKRPRSFVICIYILVMPLLDHVYFATRGLGASVIANLKTLPISAGYFLLCCLCTTQFGVRGVEGCS